MLSRPATYCNATLWAWMMGVGTSTLLQVFREGRLGRMQQPKKSYLELQPISDTRFRQLHPESQVRHLLLTVCP